MAKPVTCVDCKREGVTRWRATPHGGPRSPLCVSHFRARKKMRRVRAHELHIARNFELSGEDYWGLYEFQGGMCFVCRRARGISKRLAVDHDHDVAEFECGHDRDVGCPHCIRCLSCSVCNEMLGRYDVEALARAIMVKTNPPAQQYFRERLKGGK